MAEVIAFGEDARQKFNEIENRDTILAELRVRLAAVREVYQREAAAVSKLRTAGAVQLLKLAEGQINDLAMKVRLNVTVTPQDAEAEWSGQGWDRIDIF